MWSYWLWFLHLLYKVNDINLMCTEFYNKGVFCLTALFVWCNPLEGKFGHYFDLVIWICLGFSFNIVFSSYRFVLVRLSDKCLFKQVVMGLMRMMNRECAVKKYVFKQREDKKVAIW